MPDLDAIYARIIDGLVDNSVVNHIPIGEGWDAETAIYTYCDGELGQADVMDLYERVQDYLAASLTRYAQPRNWRESQEATDFIATADSRETSPEIMKAIAFFAESLDEAESLWNGDGFGQICNLSDLWDHVTCNGRRDATEFCWGAAGSQWWDHIKG